MDAVYIVGPSQNNEELRYSLRSLRNLPHGRVWIVGHRLPWLANVEHVSTRQVQGGPRKYQNGFQNIQTACSQDGMTEDIILMNDDFFVMEKIARLPALHQGPLSERLAAWRKKSMNARYPAGGLATGELLRLLARMAGRDPDALLDYEVHVPMVVNRLRFASLLEDVRPVIRTLPIHRRTLYGNMYRIGGSRIEDVKVWAQSPIPKGPFASTSNNSFNQGRAGKQIREAFPDPSEYEQ